MRAKILDGREISKNIREGLKERIALIKDRGITPSLATIIIGGDPSSRAYVKNQERVCREAGLEFHLFELPREIKEEKVIELIEELNNRRDIHGIMVQVPLPRHISEERVARSIRIDKDVDGFNPENAGRLLREEKCLLPCTPKGVVRLLEEYNIELEGRTVGVLGRSNIVGKPAALLLLNKHATVTVCHSRTQNLEERLRACDIIVSAVGKPSFVKAHMVRKGVVVVDVGTTVVDGRLKGDVDFEGVSEVASYITPVPGGVGAMTTAMLIENVLEAVEFYD